MATLTLRGATFETSLTDLWDCTAGTLEARIAAIARWTNARNPT